MSKIDTHTLNSELVLWFFNRHRQNILYSYSVSSYIMGGLGYMKKAQWLSEVSDFCQVSEKTVYRWLQLLLKYQLLKEKGDTLYIKGKKSLMNELGIRSKNAISLYEEDLKDKTKYKKILVEQIGLLCQKRYRYAHKEIVKHSSISKGRIENRNGVARKSYNVGCSLSYLSMKTGLSKTQVSRSLSSTRKVSQVREVLFLREFKAKYDNTYFRTSKYLSYSFEGGKYYIKETLPSVIEADSKLKRSKL